MPEQLTIDHASEATGTPLALMTDPYAIESMDFPAPAQQTLTVGSIDTDGDLISDRRHENRKITFVVEIVTSTNAATVAALRVLEEKVGKLASEGGTLTRTMQSGSTITFDVLTADGYEPAYDLVFFLGNVARVQITLTAAPYGRGGEIAIGYAFDDFSTNTIANYAFDSGSGLSVSGGQLVPSTTAEKRLYRIDPTDGADVRVTRKFITGASVAGSFVAAILKRVSAPQNLAVQIAAATGSLSIEVGNWATTLATTAGVALSPSTSYWLRAWVDGNVVIGELWTAAPTPGGTPLRTVTTTLAGADATAYGSGVVASTGLRFIPQATDWRVDDWTDEAFFETAEPALVLTAADVPGDVPAIGRLVVNEDQGQDQFWVTWGLQSRYYSSAATAKLFYEAEALNPIGGAAAAAGAGGASGSGSNVVRYASLPAADYQAILSTQAAGAGAHMTHVGTFRVWARVMTAPSTANTGTTSVALQWGEGDLRRFVLNTPASIDTTLNGTWRLVDLGLVKINPVVSGTQRWEGRIVAKSTVAGDDIDIDCLMFVPVDEGSGEVTATVSAAIPATYTARDEFDQTAGTLNAKTLPLGGTWATSGAATDFAVTGAGAVTRATAAVEGYNAGRIALAGTSTLTDAIAAVDITWANEAAYTYSGLILRYVDANNYLGVVIQSGALAWPRFFFFKAIAGVFPNFYAPVTHDSTTPASPITGVRLTAIVNRAGMLTVNAKRLTTGVGADRGRGEGSGATVTMQLAELATGGVLATGKFGIYDARESTTANTRTYDNFTAYVPATDAAIFAAQSLEIRHDQAVREDSAGAILAPVSNYEGDYLLIPPSGQEARTSRLIVKASRNDPAIGADLAVDDISARLCVRPRYLTIPD